MVYKTEYSTRRVYSSGSPTPNISTSYSYSASPISRRRKPLVTTRVIRIPSSMPLSDQEVLNFITVGSGRAGSVPRVAFQRLSGSVPPVRSNVRLNSLYSELEDEVARDSQGLGALVPYRSARSMTPVRALSPGPIKRITYHSPSVERELPSYTSVPEPQPYVRSRADDALLQWALGIATPLYSLHHIPLRSALDVKEACDVRRQFVHERNLYDPLSRIQSDIYRMAFNRAPRKLPEGYIAGNGTLACLTYAGGRPIPKRRRFYPDDVISVINTADDNASKFNNYYKPSAVGSYYSTAGKKPVYQPVFRSRKTLLGLPDTPASYKKGAVESKWETRSAGKKSPSPPPVRQPPRRIISTTPSSPPPEPRRPAADNISITLPKPRKSVSDDEVFIPPPSPTAQQLDVPEAVVVRIPRKSISQEPPEKPAAEPVAEEEVVQVVKIKRPSIKPEPEPEPVQEAPAAEPEAAPADEPAGEPESTPASEPAIEAPASAEAATPEPESAPAEPTAEAAEPEPAAPAATESEPEPAPTTESSVAEPEPAEAEPSVAEPESAPIAESSVAEPEPAATESSTAEPEPVETSTAEPEGAAESSVAEPEPATPTETSEPEQVADAAETSEAAEAPVEPEPAAETSAAESAPAGDSAAEAAAEVSEAATADDDASAAPATEEISAAAEEPSNQAEPAKDEEEAVTNVEDTSLVEPSVEKEETDRQIASPVEGYGDEPAELEDLPYDPEESQSEAQRPGVSEDDRTLEED